MSVNIDFKKIHLRTLAVVRATLFTDVMIGVSIVPIKYSAKLCFNILKMKEFFVQLIATLFAVPLQAIVFFRSSLPFDHKANGSRRPLW